MPPPQGFSHASLSSRRRTCRVLASREAQSEPAGPAPMIAMSCIAVVGQANCIGNRSGRGTGERVEPGFSLAFGFVEDPALATEGRTSAGQSRNPAMHLNAELKRCSTQFFRIENRCRWGIAPVPDLFRATKCPLGKRAFVILLGRSHRGAVSERSDWSTVER